MNELLPFPSEHERHARATRLGKGSLRRFTKNPPAPRRIHPELGDTRIETDAAIYDELIERQSYVEDITHLALEIHALRLQADSHLTPLLTSTIDDPSSFEGTIEVVAWHVPHDETLAYELQVTERGQIVRDNSLIETSHTPLDELALIFTILGDYRDQLEEIATKNPRR